MKFNKLISNIIAILVLSHLLSINLFSQNETNINSDKIRMLGKGISVYQLDNGLQVLLIENPALPAIGINVAIKVGSAYETFSTSGMSHMLEHLLFNGTTNRDQKKLYDDVDMIGGYNNASTSEFYTNFMMVAPYENAKSAMEIQADMLFNSILPTEKFEKEKGIVLEEISKSLADPREQLERNSLAVLYPGHALSLPTLGTYSTIQSMKRDDVNSFYKNYYVPNNMVLTAIGNFNSKDMLKQINEIYGKSKPGVVVKESYNNWGTGFDKLSETGKDSKSLNRFYSGDDTVIEYYFDIPTDKSVEYYSLLGIMLDKNKDAFQSNLKKNFGKKIKNVSLSLRNTPIANAIEISLTLATPDSLSIISNDALKAVKSFNFSMTAENVVAEAIKANTDFVKNLEKPHMFGIYNSYNIVVNGVEAVLSSFDKNAFLSASKILSDLKLNEPSLILLQSPAPKKLENEEAHKSSAELFSDPKGRDLIVVQNESSNLLAIHYLVKHKASFELKYGKDAAKILHDCLDQRLKLEANQKISSNYGFTFTVNDNPYIPMDDIYLHPDFGYIRVEGLANDMNGAISYLNNQFKGFIPTAEEFKKSSEKFKGMAMMSMGGDKSKKTFDAEYNALVKEQSQYSKIETVLTYESLVEFSKEYFDPNNMIISVVSPETPENVRTMFASFTGSTTSDRNYFTTTYASQDKPVTIEKSLGGERAYLFYGFVSSIDTKDAPALQALSLILADQIVFDIREKQGMAYNMSAGIDVVKDKALFYINQGTRSQNVEKLVPQYPGFFKLSVLDNLTNETLQKSINMYLGKMMFRRLSSINQGFYLGTSLYFNDDINYDKKFLDALKMVNVEEVKNVAKKYMTDQNPTTIIVK